MEYYVHIYAVCRCKVGPITAESQSEAVVKANDMDMNALFDKSIGFLDEVEFADKVEDFLVDEVGDNAYEKTRLYKLDKYDKPKLIKSH
jgi:hypothetical protein